MTTDHQLFAAVSRAAIIAGPLFLSLLLLLDFQQSTPAAFAVSGDGLVGLVWIGPVIIFLSSAVGALLAFPTCVLVGGALWLIASRVPLARLLPVWIAVGGASAIGILLWFFGRVEGIGTYAFVGTAMACAAIVRSRLHWE